MRERRNVERLPDSYSGSLMRNYLSSVIKKAISQLDQDSYIKWRIQKFDSIAYLAIWFH